MTRPAPVQCTLGEGVSRSIAGRVGGAGLGQDTDFSLQVDFERERPVDRVLERVDPTSDVWIEEQDYEAIVSELKAVAKGLLKDPTSFQPLTGQTSGFRSLKLAEFKIVASAVATRRAT